MGKSRIRDKHPGSATLEGSYNARDNLIGLSPYIHDGKLSAGKIEIKAVIVCLNEEAAPK